MTTGRINQNATCFCWLSQEHQRRGGGRAGGKKTARTTSSSSPAVAQNAQIQGFSRHRTNPQRAPPAHSRNSYGGPERAHSRGGTRRKRRKETSPALSLSLSPARIPRAERHSIDTSASTSRPVKPYTVGRQRAEYADPATR